MTLKKLRADSNGTAVIEFAMAMPVLITIMIGILQFALVLQASGAMRHGMGEGLRYAKVNAISDPSDAVAVAALKAKVEEIAKDSMAGIDRDHITSMEFTSGTSDGADYGQLDVKYQMQPLIPFAPLPPITINESRTVFLPS